MKIKTDNKWKNFKYANEVPRSVLKNQFDYLDQDEAFDGFILYKKTWYHIGDFMRFGYPGKEEFRGYHGYVSDSFFSGVMIKISDDGEQYQIATYIS